LLGKIRRQRFVGTGLVGVIAFEAILKILAPSKQCSLAIRIHDIS
jgi:hypothetical protein